MSEIQKKVFESSAAVICERENLLLVFKPLFCTVIKRTNNNDKPQKSKPTVPVLVIFVFKTSHFAGNLDDYNLLTSAAESISFVSFVAGTIIRSSSICAISVHITLAHIRCYTFIDI